MRRAVRALLARPGFTIVAIATLTLGFGANAAVFSLTRTVLLRELPYRDADRLVQVNETSVSLGVNAGGVSPANYVAWRERVTAFEQTAFFRRVQFNVSTAFWIPRSRGGAMTIVGVVRDVSEDGLLDSAGFPQMYLPYAQNPTVVSTIVARAARGPAETAAAAIRRRRSTMSIHSCRCPTR